MCRIKVAPIRRMAEQSEFLLLLFAFITQYGASESEESFGRGAKQRGENKILQKRINRIKYVGCLLAEFAVSMHVAHVRIRCSSFFPLDDI